MGRAVERPGIMGKWKLSRERLKSRRPRPARLDLDRAYELETAVLRGPIHSAADAIAKLRAIELAFIEGERTDGADAIALKQTIRWLKANSRACAQAE